MKVKVNCLPYIFQALYVWCFTRPRNQVSVYKTIGPLVTNFPLMTVGLFGTLTLEIQLPLILLIIQPAEKTNMY